MTHDPTNPERPATARDELLQLMAEWGLTTGRGSREHADRILNRNAHELAEHIRADSARGRKSGFTRIYYRAAADMIDPDAHDDPLTVLRAVEDAPGYELVPGCPHCPDGHTPPDHGQTWGAHLGPERDGDGQPTQIVVARSAGAHVAESDAEWIRARLNDTGEQR